MTTEDPSSNFKNAPAVTPEVDHQISIEQLGDNAAGEIGGNGAPTAEATYEEPSSGGRSRRKRKSPLGDFFVTSDVAVKRQPKKIKDPEDEFENSWICCECKEAECMITADADQLLICEGPCRRLSHYPCAGLKALPAENEEYICNDCRRARHQCSFCLEYGEDDTDVFRCAKESCGHFFHPNCLDIRNVQVEYDSKLPDDGTDLVCSQGKPSFVCPAHSCWTCTQTEELETEIKEASENSKLKKAGKRGKKSKSRGVFIKKSEKHMVKCMVCPISFHITCIPPMAAFHELATLCHEHSLTHKLPYLDPETSLQGSIELKVDDKWKEANAAKLRRRKLGSANPFLPGVSGDALTNRETKLIAEMRKAENREEIQFCLPCDLKDEVHSKHPSYRHIQTLLYDPKHKPARIPMGDDVCNCVGFCGDECMNRMLYTECFGDGTKGNCRVGKSCGNRAISQRKFATCQPVREQGKGWGLRTKNKLMKGDLILEYIGDVIDEKQKNDRLQDWAKDHPNDPNFYIMSLRDQWYVDARSNANLSRFINHSCDPNCILIQIVVNGYVRNGIYAKTEIAAGGILSYDYQFDTKQGDRFVCRCGSANCRGTMKGGASNLSPVKKTKSEQWDDAKGRFERDKKYVEEYYDKEKDRQSQVRATVPGAENKEETVSNGIQSRYRGEVFHSRLFLWRNGVHGSDFSRRYDRAQQR